MSSLSLVPKQKVPDWIFMVLIKGTHCVISVSQRGFEFKATAKREREGGKKGGKKEEKERRKKGGKRKVRNKHEVLNWVFQIW